MADDTTSMVGFPLTYDGDAGGPAYTAQSYRLTAGAALAVPDGSAFGGVQGVRAGSPSPLVSMDGTTATVSPHMGWLCPWTGAGAYEYAIAKPVQVAVGSSTGSYKIAVVLEDKAAGHGKGELVDVKVYPGYMLDSQIPGLVVARVESGVASDVAPVVSQGATVRVGTLAQLQGIKAADGTTGLLADGACYRRDRGSWVPGGPVSAVQSPMPFSDSMMTLYRSGGLVVASGDIALRDIFANLWNVKATEQLPSGYAPRPGTAGSIIFTGNNSQIFSVRVASDQSMYVAGSGSPGYHFTYFGVWLSA